MENRQLLLVAGIIAIVALLLSNAVNLLSEYARTRYAQNFAHWLRVRLLRRMASQPYTYFLQRNSGDLLKKIMGDVTNYAGGVLLPVAGHGRARAHRSASTGYAVFGATGNRFRRQSFWADFMQSPFNFLRANVERWMKDLRTYMSLGRIARRNRCLAESSP